MDSRAIIGVIDNLESTSITDALSANQGRVLKGLIDGLGVIQSYTHNGKNGAIQFSNGFLIQHGRVDITPTAVDTPTYEQVTFGTSYSQTPIVLTQVITSNPALVFASSRDTNTTGTKIYVTRDSIYSTGVEWVAFGYKNLGN